MLTKKVVVPIDRPKFIAIPCAKTLQGEAPAVETISKPSPNPNMVSPNIKKNNDDSFGFKFRGFFELQDTLGIFFIVKNIIFAWYLLLLNNKFY